MEDPQAILSLVTLGVSDLNRSIAFYEALGFARKAQAADGVGFFQAGACAISVYPSAELAKDADIGFKDLSPAFRGISLAWNCRSKKRSRCGHRPRLSRRRHRAEIGGRMCSGAAIAAISSIPTAILGSRL